ncbi:hypothetical protein Q4574_05300 [Aliiglaciecola sp. 3_MG-2023]|uniref:hypothetical protein n=1 Tax=Aliiglaciecola sp. 3_MG-2023 TaxID=3062644 RepID=UPI0026E2C9DE|nr:hypothetical protein [Aliiglaciecola sp. 3_MG-2023]MDO6692687.1 hypothetical protein [Aliiglaciecola sp. 3_MG-2023]
MTEIPAQALIAIGAIAAAFIAGFFSFLNLVISKEQKVSEFRQEWIDAFRRELSDLTAAVFHIKFHLAAFQNDRLEKNAANRQTLATSLRESHETYCRTVTSLLLRINPDESDVVFAKMNAEFLEAFQAVRDSFNSSDYQRASDLCGDLREKAVPILKSEWKRVKRGERTYRISKWVAGLLLMLGALGMVLFASNVQRVPFSTSQQCTPANNSLQPTQ